MLQGELKAKTSKSAAHRAILCAAVCDKKTTLFMDGRNADIDATLSCLPALGAQYQMNGDALTVLPHSCTPASMADCNESGSTLRFLLPMLALFSHPVTVTGRGRLPLRPIGDMTRLLREHGCTMSGDALPVTVQGKMTGGDFLLPGNVTSQYITGLLLALPHLNADSHILLSTPLHSAGYVQMTLDMMKNFGLYADESYFVKGGQQAVSPNELQIEGDWSGAAAFFCLNHLGADIRVSNLSKESAQPDRAIKWALAQIGGEIDCDPFPDLVPVLAAACACTKTTTHLTNLSRLRLKESDRVQATADMLCALGAEIQVQGDTLVIHGKDQLPGGTADCQNDHRLVMAAAVAAYRCTGDVTIVDSRAVSKSYPDFFADIARLGGLKNVQLR